VGLRHLRGRRTADIQVEQPGWSIWTTSIPKGETVEQVGERVRRVIDRAVAAPGDVALFAHAHVLRILAACWLGLPPAGAASSLSGRRRSAFSATSTRRA
jgi:probable phosphoglycerate mutase